ncbi:MAG: DciA family protein [Acidimicrobiales bacterium]
MTPAPYRGRRRRSGGGGEPRPVADTLGAWTASLGLPAPSVLAAVFQRWPEVAGEALARGTRPVSVHGRTLVVAASQPAWATRARFESAAILARLATVTGTGAIDHIDIRVEA